MEKHVMRINQMVNQGELAKVVVYCANVSDGSACKFSHGQLNSNNRVTLTSLTSVAMGVRFVGLFNHVRLLR